ncbi:MAG: hypothetical protein KAX15_00325, partial [Candidatus Omnitrophica bacterium]|nr:hypothetical protein [Candidatus Omnitrophota bacterium]
MKENITKKNRATLLHPGWLIPITLIAGLTPSGPLAGAILLQCGHRKKGWVLGSILCLTGILILTAAALLSLEWYWVSIILITIHLISGIVLFFTLIGSYRKFMAKHNRPLSRLGSYREVITGAVAGAFLTGVLGAVFTIIYLLVIDRFFSTFMLVIFDDMFAIVKITILTCFLVLTGTLAGGFMGRFKPHISPGQMLPYTLALIWTHHTLFLALEITITIPGFQAMMATGAKLTPILLPFLLCGLIIGFWWAVFLLFFMVSPLTKTGKLSRALQVLFINLTAGITLSIYTGYPADMFLALGRYFERTALASQALQCYEQGLNKKPKDLIASYLQYHTAFLNHKQGNKEEAKDGFRRVVTKYTANKKLVKKSQRFLNRLNTTTAMEKRVVLPGIETRMDYIGASCAPNSLALVMRYWNINITARVIAQKVKGFSSGTSPITQAWFAKEHNLCHDFIPLAGITDIKQCLDAGLPVLVIVPQHIFAIFGYDERLGTFITFDTAVEENWVDYNQKDFIKTWKRTGAPLLLVYPREKEKLIPQNIRAKLMEADNNYLALWNYLYIKAATHSSPIPYLLLASGKTGEFFIPLVILYHDYPE